MYLPLYLWRLCENCPIPARTGYSSMWSLLKVICVGIFWAVATTLIKLNIWAMHVFCGGGRCRTGAKTVYPPLGSSSCQCPLFSPLYFHLPYLDVITGEGRFLKGPRELWERGPLSGSWLSWPHLTFTLAVSTSSEPMVQDHKLLTQLDHALITSGSKAYETPPQASGATGPIFHIPVLPFSPWHALPISEKMSLSSILSTESEIQGVPDSPYPAHRGNEDHKTEVQREAMNWQRKGGPGILDPFPF